MLGELKVKTKKPNFMLKSERSAVKEHKGTETHPRRNSQKISNCHIDDRYLERKGSTYTPVSQNTISLNSRTLLSFTEYLAMISRTFLYPPYSSNGILLLVHLTLVTASPPQT